MKIRQTISILLLIICVHFVFVSSSNKDDNAMLSNNLYTGKTTAVFNSNITYGAMTDQDGNVYKTVAIGSQTWMAENLRTTKYCDGSPITNIIDNNEWEILKTGAYCNYNNTEDIDIIATRGRLYNWYAVNTDKLAPTGWHIPTDDEWTQLTRYLGGESVAGRKLRECGTTNWVSDYFAATNETGLTLIPGGYRDHIGAFLSLYSYGIWWSSSEKSTKDAWLRNIQDRFIDELRDYDIKELGLSVRCVKD